LNYLFRAAELGSAQASSIIAYAYQEGDGIEKDEKKARYWTELAAMNGHNSCRHLLGVTEANAGKYNNALKHWLISSGRGHKASLESIKYLFIDGIASKRDYEKALRSYQHYICEIRSDQRDEAAAFRERYRYF
jgi:TPR repeat protein